MDELLYFDASIDSAIDWLENARSFLADQVIETEGKWEGAKEALAKAEQVLTLLKEVRIPLTGEIAAAHQSLVEYEAAVEARRL